MVWRKFSKKDLEETKNKFESEGYTYQWLAMASEVIILTLGRDWFWKYVGKENHNETYFWPKKEGKLDGDEHNSRVTKLGDMLYALKDYEGYEYFIDSLKKRNLQSTIFELQTAHLFHMNGHSIKFIEESKEKMKDYDLQATIDGIIINVEAKSKRASSILNERRLEKTLKNAQKQLPKIDSNVIFVEIPEDWSKKDNSRTLIEKCIKNFFKDFSHIHKIFILFQTWKKINGENCHLVALYEYNNQTIKNPVLEEKILATSNVPKDITPENQDYKPSFL
jgi:hypothetical protein